MDRCSFRQDVLPVLCIAVGFVLLLLIVGSMVSCQTTPPMMGRSGGGLLSAVEQHAGERLGVLSWVGGISMLAGIAALVITRGAMGARAVLIGCGLVILSFAIERFANWIFIPAIIATGICSFAIAWKTVRSALKQRKGESQ